MKTLVTAAALALLLTACSREQAEDTAGETQASEPSAQLSSGTDTAPDAQETAALTAEGWGPIRIGMTLEEVTAALGPDTAEQPYTGVELEACRIVHPERAPEGLSIMLEQDVVTRISLYEGATITTPEGLSIGSSAAAVRQAYGERLHIQPHNYEGPEAEYLTVWDNRIQTEPYVEDDTARGIRYETRYQDRNVQAIHAGGPSIQYVEGCS